MNGAQQIPIGELADVKLVAGPSMFRDENGMLSGYVYVDVARPRYRVVRDGSPAGGGPRPDPAGGVHHCLERPVMRLWRGSGSGWRWCWPLTLFLVMMAAVPEHALGGEDRHHRSGRPVLGGRRHLAALFSRVQHEHRGLGRADRVDGGGCGNRRVHAALSGYRVPQRRTRGPPAQRGRVAGGHPGRRGSNASVRNS